MLTLKTLKKTIGEREILNLVKVGLTLRAEQAANELARSNKLLDAVVSGGGLPAQRGFVARKKPHWTQTPAGRKRMAAISRKRYRDK